MGNAAKIGSRSRDRRTVREQDLRDEFEKLNEQVQKAIRQAEREVQLTEQENSETLYVVEPVYAYEVHTS